MNTKYWLHLTHIKMMQGWVNHEIKVTHLGDGIYGCRCFLKGELNCEYRAKGKESIGKACREMLRFEDKLGNWSDFAGSSRTRQAKKQYASNS